MNNTGMSNTGMSKIDTIKQRLFDPVTVKFFRESLPIAAEKESDKVANRFAKMLYTTISNSPALQQCSPQSLVKAAGISASLGLDVDPVRGLGWLVPYNNKGVTEAQFQIGYLGLIELAYRSGKVKAISAHCIYKSEMADVKITRENGRYTVHHPFSFKAPSGEMIAVYATAEVDGFGAFTEVLRFDEVEKVRRCGKAPNSPAWTSHFEAMAKKTAIRRLAKFLPKSIAEDFSRAAANDEKQDIIDVPAVSRFEKPQPAPVEEPQSRPEPDSNEPEDDDIPMDFPAVSEQEQPAKPEKRQLLTRRMPIHDTSEFELNLHTWLIDNAGGISTEQIKAKCDRDNVPFDSGLFTNDAEILKSFVQTISGETQP